MPKDRITMAIIASSSVKPDCGLRRGLFRDMDIPPIPATVSHPSGIHARGRWPQGWRWHGPSRACPECPGKPCRSPGSFPINESSSCREFHDRWAAGEPAKVNWGTVSKIIGCRKIRNGTENNELGATLEADWPLHRRRAKSPEF